MAEEKEAPGEAKGKQKPTLFIILSIFNMVIVVAVGVMLYLGKKKEAAQPTIEDVVRGEHEAQEKVKANADTYIGNLIPLETFLVNLAGSRGRKLAKVNMELEVEGEQVQEEIEKRKAQIRDIIIILLSSKTYSQVEDKEGKEHLRDEIRDTVNAFLTKGKINKVYFTEFIFN